MIDLSFLYSGILATGRSMLPTFQDRSLILVKPSTLHLLNVYRTARKICRISHRRPGGDKSFSNTISRNFTSAIFDLSRGILRKIVIAGRARLDFEAGNTDVILQFPTSRRGSECGVDLHAITNNTNTCRRTRNAYEEVESTSRHPPRRFMKRFK